MCGLQTWGPEGEMQKVFGVAGPGPRSLGWRTKNGKPSRVVHLVRSAVAVVGWRWRCLLLPLNTGILANTSSGFRATAALSDPSGRHRFHPAVLRLRLGPSHSPYLRSPVPALSRPHLSAPSPRAPIMLRLLRRVRAAPKGRVAAQGAAVIILHLPTALTIPRYRTLYSSHRLSSDTQFRAHIRTHKREGTHQYQHPVVPSRPDATDDIVGSKEAKLETYSSAFPSSSSSLPSSVPLLYPARLRGITELCDDHLILCRFQTQ